MSLWSSPVSLVILLYILWISAAVRAYIPATPTNDTDTAIQNGLNVTDSSYLITRWYSNDGYNLTSSSGLTYELVGAGTDGVTRGAFVHFSEDGLTNDTTITPWIALISCDGNSTDASDTDIFTLAKERGALAAVVYPTYSIQCMINKEYAANFDHLFDIFITHWLTDADIIEYNFGKMNRELYGSFNAQRLNESFSDVNRTLSGGDFAKPGPGYMIVALRAWNLTEPPGPPPYVDGDRDNQPQGKWVGLVMVMIYFLFSNCL